jgi:Aerotolerance regulator N-terminal
LLQLLQPIWLFALAGLSIPVIIHLWNRQPGKTLKVGSIALVKENALSYKKRIRLSEILLLLLRCLLLSCIAIALTDPAWRSRVNNASKGWVLMTRNKLPVTYNHFKPLVDSLLQAGMEFHYFEEGFTKDKFENALQPQTDSSRTIQNYRGITALLNEQADSKLPLYVFTDNYLRNFNGNRNTVSLNLHWFTYTPDTTSVQAFTDTAALRITIVSKRAYANDARYLEAAIQAIQQFSKRNIITRLVTAFQDIPAQQDWLFCLDDAAPANIKDAKNVLVYAKGEPVKYASYILPAGEMSFTAIEMYQSVIEKDSAKQLFNIRWRDGFGNPLLSVQQENNTAYYWLYTHIDPNWNELPWSDNFPAILYKLLYTDRAREISADAADKTIIDSSQLMPVVMLSKEAGIKRDLFTETKMSGICWIIAFVLFFAERSLSFYQRKINTNG